MHRIPCPWCGLRDEAEFQYRGDASVVRPGDDAPPDEHYRYVYVRRNPKGWHLEWWHHVQGCRLWIKVLRHTVTHAIGATAFADQPLELPADDPPSEGQAAGGGS